MGRVRSEPFIVLGLFINAVAMGMIAYDFYNNNNIGYAITFVILCLFLITLAIYGLVRNSKVSRTSK